MELFLEGKNKNYALILELLNSLYFGSKKTISRNEICDLVEKYGISSEFNLSQSLMNENPPYNLYLLDSNSNGEFCLSMETDVPIRPYKIERQWLKHILKNQKLRLFLEEKTIAKLEELLKGCEDIVSEAALTINRPCKQLRTVDEHLGRIFKLLVRAILENKGIEYDYRTKSGAKLCNIRGIPYKIEYSMKEDCFYLISYSTAENRPIKSLLHSFEEIRLLELDEKDFKTSEEIQKSIDGKKAPEPVILRIKDDNHALERTMFQFSCFERKLEYDKASDTYSLSVSYYEFEKEEVLSRIFSLGRHVLVTSPSAIREEMIDRLKQLDNKYSI